MDGLVIAAEYAIERLADAVPGSIEADARDMLHDALVGRPLGLGVAVGTRCPVCGARRDPRLGMESHHAP